MTALLRSLGLLQQRNLGADSRVQGNYPNRQKRKPYRNRLRSLLLHLFVLIPKVASMLCGHRVHNQVSSCPASLLYWLKGIFRRQNNIACQENTRDKTARPDICRNGGNSCIMFVLCITYILVEISAQHTGLLRNEIFFFTR